MDHYDRVFPGWIQSEQGVDNAAKELWEQDNINLSVQKREVEAIEQLGNTVPGFDATASQSTVAVASQLTLARTWFMRCLQEHANCGDGRNNQFYLMRLIDVRGASSHLVLLRDANENISGSYATLSHRWTNSDNFSSLTTEKISQFRKEIPEEHISPTFRDAIIVCKALEIPYLWIDSMCIQSGQGSLEDWHSNGLAMAAIYTNSAVNIAADINENANRVHTGFFHNSTAVEERTPTRLKISGSELVIYPTSMSIGIPKTLDKRGWIVQEMLLAPRVLRFSQGQMTSECTQNPCACEAFPAGMRNDIVAALVHREAFVSPQGRDQNRLRNLRKEILRLENSLKDPAVNSTEISGSKLPELYLDFVEVYTNCDLTFPDIDKFIALSGVVSRISDLIKGDYIAGFFRDMLPRALSWKVEKPGSFLTESTRKDIRFIPSQRSRKQRSQKYRAPTWSWAHLDKAIDFTDCVYYAHDRFPALTEVIATNVILSYPENLYGPIKHADLIVRGHVSKLQWSPDKPNLLRSSEKYDSGKFNIKYTLDRAIFVDSEREMLFLAIHHHSNHHSNPVTGVILEVVKGVEEDRVVEEVSKDRGDRGERLRQGIKDARRIGFMKMVMSIGDIKVKMEEVTLRLI